MCAFKVIIIKGIYYSSQEYNLFHVYAITIYTCFIILCNKTVNTFMIFVYVLFLLLINCLNVFYELISTHQSHHNVIIHLNHPFLQYNHNISYIYIYMSYKYKLSNGFLHCLFEHSVKNMNIVDD